MKTWKDKDNKSDNAPENASNCLLLSMRQLSFVVAANIILLFTTFILGYFWGQRYAVEQFVDKIDNNSFADQISSSLFSLQKNNRIPEDIMQSADMTTIEQSHCGKEVDQQDMTHIVHNVTANKPTISSTSYYAQLIGFGTLKAANHFVNRLQQKNIPVEVKKRVSKTARGKKIIWYQVVTKKYSDKSVLEKLVAILKEDEKLKDPCIIIC